MLNCQQITELASKSLDSKLPFAQRFELSLHVFICKNCARYRQHIRFIQHAISHIDLYQEDIKLSEDARKKIAHCLKENI